MLFFMYKHSSDVIVSINDGRVEISLELMENSRNAVNFSRLAGNWWNALSSQSSEVRALHDFK